MIPASFSSVVLPLSYGLTANLSKTTPFMRSQYGQVVPGTPSLNIAIIDFLARGGDDYPFRGKEFTAVGVSDQQAVARYIVDVLDGEITAALYPEGGEGRITRLN